MSAAMNAYNPLEAMKRLQQAGIARQHAEAIAAEIGDGMGGLVTEEQLDAALDRVTIRLSIIMAAVVSLACTVLGTVLSN